MAAELLPPETLISTAAPQPTTSAPSPDHPPPLDLPTTATTTNPPKRQRRPSVRLGEIGGEPHHYDTHPRRPNSKTWRFHKDPSFASKTSKTRPLTNLVNGAESNLQDSDNFVDFPNRKPKIRKATKRARTSWNKFESPPTPISNGGGVMLDSGNAFREVNNEEVGEFEAESPVLKEHESPVDSVENMGLQFWDQQRSNGAMLHNNSPEEEKKSEGSQLGVREWLVGLGLGRYAPVFEIHEVDDEVLPMLTLEDLKDMGINAVGSRRKMYSAILKLRKGFS